MRRFVLLATLLLAGCSWFASQPPRSYSRPAASEEQISSDVAACKEAALAVQQRDAEISQDIASRRQIDEANTYFDPRLNENLDAYGSRARYQDMVYECMKARGYGEPQD
jgi:hypothetical protein